MFLFFDNLLKPNVVIEFNNILFSIIYITFKCKQHFEFIFIYTNIYN